MELVFVLWFIFCPIFCGIVASQKGRSVFLWVLAGLTIGIFGLLWVMLLPSTKPAPDSNQTGLMMLCPYCAEPIKQKAILCRYCGSKLA